MDISQVNLSKISGISFANFMHISCISETYLRQAARMELRQDSETPEIELIMQSFRWIAMRQYNEIPADMRKLETLKSFKTCLWKWIAAQIPINA